MNVRPHRRGTVGNFSMPDERWQFMGPTTTIARYTAFLESASLD
ncbi:hypothetical protein [Granulicella cerasi]|nr:hypothetical protein [Granulicella cerasi]